MLFGHPTMQVVIDRRYRKQRIYKRFTEGSFFELSTGLNSHVEF
jgi:hypothetical protein